MKLARSTFLVAAAALLIGLSRYGFRARVPDDYDSIGFVLALDDFDLARFQPHFPGYPIYVALGRLAHFFLRSPLDAATAVSAAASAATAFGVWRITSRIASRGAAWCAIALYAGAALPWIVGGAALSDGTAAALATLSFAALLEERPILSGVLLSLMLGTRASYFPLAFSWVAILFIFQRRSLLRALVSSLLGTIAWMVPFVMMVRPQKLLELGRIHLHGHFSDWGGSVTTRPDLRLRAFSFARDLFYDGIAPRTWALALLTVIALIAWRTRLPQSRPLIVVVAVAIALPYVLWALLGQNIVEQPRHLLPLVIALLIALGCLLGDQVWLAISAIAVVLAASFPLARAHAITMPAAAQAAAYVENNYPSKTVAVFGGSAIRLFRFLTPSVVTLERTWLSEVDVDLERLDVLPPHILVTSEVAIDARRAPRLKKGPLFCRDARLDRRQPCLQLFEYSLAQGSAR